MDRTIYHISLDIQAGDSQGMLPVKLGDTARGLSFTLRQQGSPYAVSTVQRGVLTARKPDGNILFDQCQVGEDHIFYPFTSQLTAVPGEVLCELRLYGNGEELLTCPRFSILVSDRVVSDGEVVESSSEFTALSQLLEETQEIKAQWQALLEGGLASLGLSQALQGFDTALQERQPEAPPGIPLADSLSPTGYTQGFIATTPEEVGSSALVLPTLGKVRQLLQDLQTGGLDFDGGYTDQQGFLHLTLRGVELPEFTPIYIGSAAQCPQDLLIEGNRLYLSKDGQPIGDGIDLPQGGGDSQTGSNLKLLSRTSNSNFSVMDTGKEALILYTWTSTDREDGSPTGKGSASWFVGDRRVATQTVDQGDNSFNILPYLEAAMDNTVKLTIEDAYGTTRSRIWTVTVISFGLTWDLESMSTHAASPMSLRFVPTGMGEKTLRLYIDGQEHQVLTTAATGRTLTMELPALSHGAHRLTATLELTAQGETITTEPLTHVGIWYEEGNSNPVVAFFHHSCEIPQYATLSLPYLVYDPLTENAHISLYDNDLPVNTLTVDRGIRYWAYRPTVQGNTTLKITVTHTQAQATLPVTVTSLGYDIAPVTSGLVLSCSPAGHSNQESNRDQFGYVDGKGENHPFVYSPGFDWINGGFRQDRDGITALVIKKGSFVTLDRSFFEGDATASGKELKVICKATACRDYQATFLSCVHNGVGLVLKAQEGTLSSESQSLTIPYCEEEKLELDMNIQTPQEGSLATVWLSGVPSGAFVYAPSDSWAQGSPTPVTIGSPDCDVWLYGMWMYQNSLTRYDILANFIAHSGTTEEMLKRYERNDIYAANGTLSLTKLRDANPDLRILHISAGDMTTGKNHEVSCAVELTHKKGMGFTATDVTMKAQGTSSLEYGLAALNLDLDFSKAKWHNSQGQSITAFAMTETSIPVDYFNIKLNVASSENANNVVLAEEYNTYNPYRSQPRRDNNGDPDQIQKIRDTVEGHPCAVFLTNTGKAPITAGARTVVPGETILYGCGDMNNSKKNFAVFGQDHTAYPQQCCVEILNNNNSPCRFQSDDLSGETWDGAEGTSNFEFRYPKNPTASMKEAFQTMLSWVVSTNPQGATNQPLDRPALYDGVTYNVDSPAYRRAKFRGELREHFSLDSLLFHYLFTEYHLMVDNRGKNTFVSYEWDSDVGGYRWNFNKDYDNDTAAGTDNSGGLTFRYGLEDTDSIGAQQVFNGADSVLWCNLRDCFPKELQEMYHSLESQKVWDSTRILEHFSSYQEPRPEILVAEDMWAKYFMPYLNKGERRYLEMAQGTKAQQRAGFYRYQQIYSSSKYEGSVSTADAISLRIHDVADFTVTPYSHMYVRVKFGNAHTVKLRAQRGQTVEILCKADTANDLETYLYSGGSISMLGDLSGLQPKEIELNKAVKLRNLPLGNGASTFRNENLEQISFGNIGALETMELTGLAKLSGTLDLSQFQGLREIYASGSGISGVIFAPNAPVERAVLPKVSTLFLRSLKQLKDFTVVPGGLMNLRIEDCPRVDSLTMVRNAPMLQRGRLTGVNWQEADTDLLLRLEKLQGYDEQGHATEHFVLTGRAYVPTLSQEELEVLQKAFPGLDLSYGAVVPAYTLTFQKEDGTVLYTQAVRQGGTCPDPVTEGWIPTPTKEPTVGEVFAYSGWDQPLTDVREDRHLTAQFVAQVRKYTVRWFDGGRLLQSDTVSAFDEVRYQGADLSSQEPSQLWIGWNQKDTDLQSVTRDMDVYSAYMSALTGDIPMGANYDYLYSDDEGDSMAYTLEQFYSIIARGMAKDYFQIGDKVKICVKTSTFSDRVIELMVYGFKHFKLAGQETFAEVVFGMTGVMNGVRVMNTASTNEGGWAATELRRYLNQSVLAALPPRWRSMMKTVRVLSSAGHTSDQIVVSEDKLFLFSSGELGENATTSPYVQEVEEGAEQTTFSLITDVTSRVRKTYNGTGTASIWWTRSPEATSNTGFRYVGTQGGIVTGDGGKGYYISFGFCI